MRFERILGMLAKAPCEHMTTDDMENTLFSGNKFGLPLTDFQRYRPLSSTLVLE